MLRYLMLAIMLADFLRASPAMASVIADDDARIGERSLNNREALSKRSFLEKEKILLDEISSASSSSANNVKSKLIDLYMGEGLFAEALGVIRTLPDLDLSHAVVAGEAAYRMGRYKQAEEFLAVARERDDAQAIAAMAMARQGAFSDSLALFTSIDSASPEWARFEYDALMARAAINEREFVTADNAIRRLRSHERSQNEESQLQLLLADRLSADGETNKALRRYSALTRSENIAVRVEAGAAAISVLLERGDISAEQALLRLRGLSLMWEGGLAEIRLLQVGSAFSDISGKYEQSFAFRNALIDRFPNADASKAALEANRRLLSGILEDPMVSPLTAASIFYQNIEFAPPGTEGDILIRRVASQLVALDLGEKAAELLEHQVFNRLRGEERAQEAANLAELYLQIDQSSDSLRVLRSTRLARLDPAIIEIRRHLEARALIDLGDTTTALALLREDQSEGANMIRGEIFWNQARWVDAAVSFEAAIRQKLASKRINDFDVLLTFRTASAYQLAGLPLEAKTLIEDATPYIGGRYGDLATAYGNADGSVDLSGLSALLDKTFAIRSAQL